jgi:cell division protein FtsZ
MPGEETDKLLPVVVVSPTDSDNKNRTSTIMRTLVLDAIKYLDGELNREIPEASGEYLTHDESNLEGLAEGGEPIKKSEMLIIGCGGTGNSVINRLFQGGFSGPRTMVIDQDNQTFQHSHASVPFYLSRKYFRDRDLCVLEGHPDIVMAASKNAYDDLKKQIGNPDLCIIVAGMGGNVGTGSAPVIAEIAKSNGSVVTVFVTLPSHLEKPRIVRARKGLEELLLIADSVFVLDLGNLLGILPKDLPLMYIYSSADQIIAEVIRNLYDRVCTPSLINLDYADLLHLLTQGGYGTLLFGETQELTFVDGICKDCWNNMMRHIPISDITSCIVLIEGHSAGLNYSEQIATGISYYLKPYADVIWAANEDHSIPDGEVRAFVLVSTGEKNSIIKGFFEKI